MTTEQLKEWINHSEQMDRDAMKELDRMKHLFPESKVVHFLYLKALKNVGSGKFFWELKLSPYWHKDERLEAYLFDDVPFIKGEEQEETPSWSTLEVIDNFLNFMGDKDRNETTLEEIIEGELATRDYVSNYLSKDCEELTSQKFTDQNEMMDRFIQTSRERGFHLLDE